MTPLLFSLAGFLIMLGVAQRTKAVLEKGMNVSSWRGLRAIAIRLCGFILLANLIWTHKTNGLALNLTFFFTAAVLTIAFFQLQGIRR